MNATDSRKDLIKRAVIYIVMSVAVLTATIVLLFLMLGYRFNRQTGTIQQGGLVQFISQPAGASVTVGNAKLANVTRSKITLNPGNYDVTMDLQSYKQWKKNINVKAGSVLWLNSARFIPNDPETEKVHSFPALTSAAMRTDGKEVAAITDASKPIVTLVRMDNDVNQSRAVEIPSELVAQGESHSYGLVRWFENNRYVLIRHDYDGKTQWVVLDTEDANRSRVLAEVNGEQYIDVQLDPTNDGRLYALSASGAISRFIVGENRFETTDIKDAQSMSVTSNGTILYAAKPVLGSVGIYYASDLGAKLKLLKTITAGSDVKLAGATYFNDFYLAQTIDDATVVYKYDTLESSNSEQRIVPIPKLSFTNKEPVSSLTIRADGRFVVAESAHRVAVYDNELEKQYVTQLSRTDAGTRLTWLDTYHMGYVSNGSLVQVEFDGTNTTSIVKADAQFPAAYSANKYLYSIVKDSNGYGLQRTKLIVD